MFRRLYIKIETEAFSITICKFDKNKIEIELEKYYLFDYRNKDNDYAINEICYEICDKIKIVEEKFKIKNKVGIIQTESTMLREIEVLKKSSQKDVEFMLNIEMKKLGGFNLKNNIIIRRKTISSDGDFAKERIEIFPRIYLDLFKKIENISKIRCKAIYTDYELIEKLWIKKQSADNILEFRKRDLIYNHMDKNGVKESIVIRNVEIDNDFVEFIKKCKCFVILDKDNNKYKVLLEKLKEVIVVEKEELFKIEIEKKKLHNFLEDNYTSKLYKKVLLLLFIILILMQILFIRYFLSNRILENKISELECEKVIDSKTKDQKTIVGFKNLYGTDLNYILSEIEKGRGTVYSIVADKNNIEVDFVSPNRKEIEKILKWDMNKNAKIEYIRAETISREEAKNTYGIGDKDEKSDKEIRKEGFKENNKKEACKTWENIKEEKNNKIKKWKKNNKRKNCKIFCGEEKGKENKENKKIR